MNKTSQNTVPPEIGKADRQKAYRRAFWLGSLPVMVFALALAYLITAIFPNALGVSVVLVFVAIPVGTFQAVRVFDRTLTVRKDRRDRYHLRAKKTQDFYSLVLFCAIVGFFCQLLIILGFMSIFRISMLVPVVVVLATYVSTIVVTRLCELQIQGRVNFSPEHDYKNSYKEDLSLSDVRNMIGTTNPDSPNNPKNILAQTKYI